MGGRGPVPPIARILLVLGLAAGAFLVPGAAAVADVPNPPWPSRCPQRIVLLLDLSSSIGPNLDTVKQSADDLVDALRGAPNEVAVLPFGTDVAVEAPVDVSVEADRRDLKDRIDDLELLEDQEGGTNWEAALSAARSLDPDLVLLLTDGFPTVHGQPATSGSGPADPEHVVTAGRVADAMRSGNIRIVGIGMGLPAGNVPNLVRVTGPAEGDDFYRSNAAELLDRLYQVASKACGIPVAALPQPEPAEFPFLPVLGGLVGAVLLLVGGGVIASRRLNPVARDAPPTIRREKAALPDPSITHDELPAHLTAQPRSTVERDDPPATVEHDDPPTTVASDDPPSPPEAPRRPPRRIALDRHRGMQPPERS